MISSMLVAVTVVLLCARPGSGSVPRLVEHPGDVVVGRDEPATLRCEAVGQPRPEITWLKDGVPVRTAPADPTSHRVLLPSGALFFLRAVQSGAEDDRGTYWCLATNSDGEVESRKAQLDIATLKSTFLEEPLDSWVVRGEEVRLPCHPPQGHPTPTVEWRKNGEVMTEDERLRLAGSSLIISSAQQADEGRYQCIARNIAGVRLSTQALLSVYVPPFVIKAPENSSAEAGEEAVFSCVVGGDPSPQISWVRQGGRVSYIPASEEDAAVLRIKNVSEAEAGKYVCHAENIAGELTSPAYLKIQVPPVFVIKPQDKLVRLGDDVLLQCKVDPQQDALLFWQISGSAKSLLPGTKENNLSVDKMGNLHIESVRGEDEGWLGCFAVSPTGSSSALARLSLKTSGQRPPPIIQLGPVNQTVSSGNILTLHCQFTARDKARVAWLKEGIPIEFSDNDRYYLTDGYNLQIKECSARDSGLYTCLIKTVSGQSSASASVRVEEEGEGRENKTSITDMLAFPASPSKPKLVSSGPDHLSVAWGKPHRVGASPLRGYQVEYYSSALTANHWVVSQVQEEQFTLNTAGETGAVIFLVRARNEHGLSPPSPLSEPLRQGGQHGGQAGGKLRKKSEVLKQISDKLVELEEVAVLGSKKVRLSWKVLASSESIHSYDIHLGEVGANQPGNLARIGVSGGGTTSHLLSRLKPNTEYSVFIIPHSRQALSRPTSLKIFKTKEDVPDTPPTNVRLKLANATSAMVSWARPVLAELYEEMTGYKVEIFTNNSLVANFTLEPSATSLMLNNITTDVIYSVRLAVFNRAGMGPFSEPVSLRVEPSLELQHSVSPQSDLPVHSPDLALNQTWFVSLVGILSIILILLAVGFVFLKRKLRKDKNFDHYDVPVCKQSEESPQSYLESDTVWINPHKPAGSYQDNSHLYVNKICPPEYSELESRASYRNLNHCTPSHQAGQYYASSNIMDHLGHSLHSSKARPGSEMSVSEVSGGLLQAGPGDSSSCSSRHSESYKLSGSRSDSSQGSGGAGKGVLTHYMSDDLIRHCRVPDPGLPPPVPPLRGPSSYSAGVRPANSFNSFGLQSSGGEIYGYRHFYSPPCNNHYETASIYQDTGSSRYSKAEDSAAGRGRRGQPKKPKKVKRRMSDVGKSNNSDNNIPANKHKTKLSQSVTSSPALARKSKPTTEILERGSKAGLGFDCDRTYTENEADRVSEDINDMVEQIHAIQQDISQLAGRPISLIDYKQ